MNVVEERLRVINSVAPNILAGVRRARGIVESYHRRVSKLVRVEHTRDYSYFTIYIDLRDAGAERPLVITISPSVQKTPIRPAQVVKRVRSFRKMLKRVHEWGPTDRIEAIVAKGYTSGAVRELRRSGIHPLRSSHDLVNLIKRYFIRRWNALVSALRSASGGRVYGSVALFLRVIAEIMKALGIRIDDYTTTHLTQAAISTYKMDVTLLNLLPEPPPVTS